MDKNPLITLLSGIKLGDLKNKCSHQVTTGLSELTE